MRTQTWTARDANKLRTAFHALIELHSKLMRAGYFDPRRGKRRRKRAVKLLVVPQPPK